MNRRFHIFFMLVLVLAMPRAGAARSGSPSGQDSLGRVLEGLEPAPRIAYLMYLLETRSEDPEVCFQLGVAYHEAEKPDSALRYYRRAVELSPGLSKAYVNMGVLFDGRNDRREAIRMFERAAEVDPDDLLAHAHLAYSLFGAGEYEAADAHISKALAIDSLDPQPHFYLAIFFWESGMFKESLVEWEKVVACAPNGALAAKARENIAILQHALLAPVGEAVPPPRP